MAQYFTDFSSEPTGGLDDYPSLSDWTPRLWYQTSGWNVTADTVGIGKHLIVSPSSARKISTFNRGSAADVNVYGRFYVGADEVPKSGFLAARADTAKNLTNDNSSAHFYYGGLDEGNIVIAKYVNGVQSVLVSTPAGALTEDVRVLFSVVGSALSVKAWSAADQEPGAWSLTTTDTDIPEAGAAGIVMNAFAPAPLLYYTEFGVGTGTDDAPRAPVPIDFVEIREADSKTVYTVGTTLNVAISDYVQAGDLILIPYYCRATSGPPTGYTKIEAIRGGYSQRAGVMWKIADGSEAGTTVTLTQASSGRLEAMHIVLQLANTVEQGSLDVTGGTGFGYTLSAVSVSRAVSLFIFTNAFADSNALACSLGIGADPEYFPVNTSAWNHTNANRLQSFLGFFQAADTQDVSYVVSGSSRDTIGMIINFIEVAGAITPTLSLPTATQIMANSIVPRVTVTF